MEIFVHSRPISSEAAEKIGCFTTLPIRIHKRDDIADAASRRLMEDWEKHIGDGWEKASHASLNPTEGNLCCFIFPECRPERLGVLTYLTDLGLFHDDACEEMEVEEATAEHSDLVAAMDINDERQLHKESSSMQKKRLVSQALLECIKLDRELGIDMLDMYRMKWLAVMEHPDTEEFLTLEQYLAFRRNNIGMAGFWPMVRFGMALKLSEVDIEMVKEVFEPAEITLMLTNDYYSWEREYEVAKKMGAGRLVNAIAVLMKEKSLSIKEAKQTVKTLIIDNEVEHVRRRTQFYIDNPLLPFRLKKWIEVAGLIVSGNNFWCVNCPRHNAWKTITRSEGKKSPSTVNSSTTEALGIRKTSKSIESMSENTSLPLDEHDNEVSSSANDSTKPSMREINHQERDSDIPRTAWYRPKATAISAPINYIKSLPSKGVRTSMIEAMNVWFNVRKENLNIITETVNTLHNSSLILDDLEDDSSLRRGKPSTHVIFGAAQAINSANFMYILAVKAVQRLNNPRATVVLLDELENLHLGQSWDLYWKHNLVCPSEEEYLNMVDNKTGGMFRLLTKLLETQSPLISTFNFDRLNLLFGRFFQIRDDYMNLQSGEYSAQKGICEDLEEGKISYLVVYCLTQRPDFKDHVLGLFRRHVSSSPYTMQQEHKTHILECMEDAKTFQHTLNMLTNLEEDIDREIGSLELLTGEENPLLRLLVARLSIVDLAGENVKLRSSSPQRKKRRT